MTSQYVALIPAYNPTQILYSLVKDLCDAGFSIVIVNDGSKDTYSNIFDGCSSRATILHHPKNTGKGQAIKTGLQYIQDSFASDSVVVTVDANGQHAVEDAIAVCEQAKRHARALILGQRQFNKEVSLRSRFRNQLTVSMLRRNANLRMRDPLSGLRAFTVPLIPLLLSVNGQRYDYEINVLLQFSHGKVRVLEHPVKTVYDDRYSLSHFKMVKEVLRQPSVSPSAE